jgi:hypothetical protein
MFEAANRCIGFFHSARVAFLAALLLPIAALDTWALLYSVGAVMCVYGAVNWYVFIERSYRANQMIRSLVYEDLAFEFYYEANGDFRSRCFFKLRNNGTDAVAVLPSTRAFFLNEGTIKSIKFRAIEEAGNAYRFQQNNQSIVDAVSALFRSNTRFVEWGYEIAPPLRPGDSVSYEVAIETEKTEVAAFTSSGSIMGFPAHIPIVSATLRAVAPRDFKFVCLGTPVVVDLNVTSEIAKPETEALPAPSFSATSAILEWKLSNLDQGYRYWIKFKFVPEVFDSTEVSRAG